MSDVVHAAPRAERRRAANNVRDADGVGARDKAMLNVMSEITTLIVAELSEAVWKPACVVCATEAKRAQLGHEVAVQVARRAAEPVPDVPQVKVHQAFTIDPQDGPVCWDHFRLKVPVVTSESEQAGVAPQRP